MVEPYDTGSSKECRKCGNSKAIEEFHRDKSRKDGYRHTCKSCISLYQTKYRTQNAKSIKERKKKYYIANKEKIKERVKKWCADNTQKTKKYKEDNYRRNKEKYLNKHKERYQLDPNFAGKAKRRASNWYRNNKKKAHAAVNKRAKERRISDPEYQAACSARNMFGGILRKLDKKKTINTFNALGYSAAELRANMEMKFQPGMSWNNRSEWHIDHIKPVAQFIKEGITDPAIINALDNLQPLWAAENQSKGSKWRSENVAI